MPQKSSIEMQLDEQDRKSLDQMIMSGKWTLAGLLEWLGEKGYDIKRSPLHRHVQKVERLGAKLRQSRTMTEALVKELGPDITEGKQGRLLVEVLRSLVFDHLSKQLDADDEGGDGNGGFESNDFFFLAKALKEMASANKIDADRELKLKAEMAKEMVKELDKAVEEAEADGEPGLKGKRLDALKEKFLGVRKPNAEGA